MHLEKGSGLGGNQNSSRFLFTRKASNQMEPHTIGRNESDSSWRFWRINHIQRTEGDNGSHAAELQNLLTLQRKWAQGELQDNPETAFLFTQGKQARQ